MCLDVLVFGPKANILLTDQKLDLIMTHKKIRGITIILLGLGLGLMYSISLDVIYVSLYITYKMKVFHFP